MFSIILPTYNERESILNTISRIRSILKSKYDYEILVVDDNSPDNTWKLVQDTFKNNSKINCLRRFKNKGLSRSVIEGFEFAKGDYVFVMDADGQHDESILPKMFKKILHSDLVIGTRFIKGGSVEGWSKKRIFMSRFAALLAKPFISSEISDPMSGFFGIKKSVFLDYRSKLNGSGYKILLDILFQNTKFKVSEVPFHFKIREQGESKLTSKVMVDYGLMLVKHFLKINKKLISFAIIGSLGVIVNTAILFSLTELVHLFYVLSSIIAVEVSIIFNFIFNDAFTWKSRKLKSSYLLRFVKFNLVSLVALILNVSILFILTNYFSVWYVFSNLIGIIFATGINFFLNDIWTFGGK